MNLVLPVDIAAYTGVHAASYILNAGLRFL